MKVLYVLLIAVLLAGCGPSAEQLTATAVVAQAQTQTAAPTFTPTATSTPTLTITPTSTLTATITPSPTPSSTPTPDVTVTATPKSLKSKGGLPGQSIADATLQKDVLNIINMLEGSYGCQTSKITDTKLISSPVNGTWKEDWIVDRCGTKTVIYHLTFKSSPAGGTDISFTIEQ